MLSILFPPAFGRRFPGHISGIVLFALLILFELAISVGSTLNARGAAVGADKIPVDSYGVDGATAFLSLFCSLGAVGVALALVGLIALIRYRAMIPLIALIYALLAVAKRVIDHASPLPGRPPSDDWLTLGTIMLSAWLLVLLSAYWRGRAVAPGESVPAA